jgi:thiamine-monophosphate kinase
VRAWQGGATPDTAARLAFALPTPRIAEAAWLAGRGGMRALLDLSDGLGGDAGHIAAASGVRIILDAAAIPIHPAARDAARQR